MGFRDIGDPAAFARRVRRRLDATFRGNYYARLSSYRIIIGPRSISRRRRHDRGEGDGRILLFIIRYVGGV